MFLKHLENINIILASGSPRRKQLLESLDIHFSVETKNISEQYPVYLQRQDIAQFLSRQKAYSIRESNMESFIISADTIVIQRNDVLGKPENRDQAIQMLQRLSGTFHEVITGVTLVKGTKESTFFERTEVLFKKLTNEEINYYIDKYQPFDKAGSYGIQEWIGMIGIQRIQGDYFNVVGLPLHRLTVEIEKFFDPNYTPVPHSPDISSKYLYFNS